MHPSVTDYGISVGGRPLTTTSSIYSLESRGPTINFIDNWLQCFEQNYGEITGQHRENMRE